MLVPTFGPFGPLRVSSSQVQPCWYRRLEPLDHSEALNSSADPGAFVMPPPRTGGRWRRGPGVLGAQRELFGVELPPFELTHAVAGEGLSAGVSGLEAQEGQKAGDRGDRVDRVERTGAEVLRLEDGLGAEPMIPEAIGEPGSAAGVDGAGVEQLEAKAALGPGGEGAASGEGLLAAARPRHRAYVDHELFHERILRVSGQSREPARFPSPGSPGHFRGAVSGPATGPQGAKQGRGVGEEGSTEVEIGAGSRYAAWW